MFSEELYIMDRNTERLMVTDLQNEVTALHGQNTTLRGENKVLQQERDILRLSLQGITAGQIADTLDISLETVNEILKR